MLPILTFSEIRKAESKIIKNDLDKALHLMEKAGKKSFEIIKEKHHTLLNRGEVLIICGKGNNAGDGYTIARYLADDGFKTDILLLIKPEEFKGAAKVNYERLFDYKYSENIKFNSSLKNFVINGKFLVIDCILGTGIEGKPSILFLDAIKFINKLKKNNKSYVISIDCPSGLTEGSKFDEIVNADMTITIGAMKSELLFGNGKNASGKIVLAPIGLDKSILKKESNGKNLVELKDISKISPVRKPSSYKYSNGKVLVIGGSRGLSGSIEMSAISALKSGAGAVTAACPESVIKVINKKWYELVTVPLSETKDGTIAKDSYKQIEKRLKWADIVLLGPGISTNEETSTFVFDVILKSKNNLVIDADALNILSHDLKILKKIKSEVILTPHLGEFERLSGFTKDEIIKDRYIAVKKFAKRYSVNVVLKSETTLSCTKKGEIFINPTGNQSLATAGTGDILSGLIASIFAQTNDSKTSMLCGNYLHGLTADLYFKKFKNKQTATPRDLINLISSAVSATLDNTRLTIYD